MKQEEVNAFYATPQVTIEFVFNSVRDLVKAGNSKEKVIDFLASLFNINEMQKYQVALAYWVEIINDEETFEEFKRRYCE